jgi:hypothetical protein
MSRRENSGWGVRWSAACGACFALCLCLACRIGLGRDWWPLPGDARHPPFRMSDTHRLGCQTPTFGCQTPTVWGCRLPDTHRLGLPGVAAGLPDTHRLGLPGVAAGLPDTHRLGLPGGLKDTHSKADVGFLNRLRW